MSDIIRLLPDHIANQIAAGEVIQRPSSVVKELLENAIDAGSTEIKLIVKDSGKTLIQVIDNGKGMSETDARMCFERHATSKISNADDLFAIKTKGFRGEALASIAAIAHVELITKTSVNELASRILIEGSEVKKQEYAQSHEGTNFSVKNLFYNVPARRKFLKSDPVEFRHIVDEFLRVALAHPEIFFQLIHNGAETYHLPKSKLKQRIVSIFGKNMDDKLLPVTENSDTIKISGFVSKAEIAKRNPGDQYLFVNHRFIKSNYLNHAVRSAYEQLLQKDQYPTYFLYLELDPASIDINVHPTKTEIKFDEERLIYNYIRGCVKHALGKYILSPTLDFETDTNFGLSQRNFQSKLNQGNQDIPAKPYNDFQGLERENIKNWEVIYQSLGNKPESESKNFIPNQSTFFTSHDVSLTNSSASDERHQISGREPYQIHNSYIISHIKSGFMIIDQSYAHERILYEEILKNINGGSRATQKELFPQILEFDTKKAELFRELLPFFNKIGFEIEEFGQNSFVVHGTPAGLEQSSGSAVLINEIMDHFEMEQSTKSVVAEKLAASFAKTFRIKKGKLLSADEMRMIVDKLFACETPFVTPGGKKCFITMGIDQLKLKFNN
jgi:DNA mismatch repair protein MutL